MTTASEIAARELLRSVRVIIQTAIAPIMERIDRLDALVHKIDTIDTATREAVEDRVQALVMRIDTATREAVEDRVQALVMRVAALESGRTGPTGLKFSTVNVKADGPGFHGDLTTNSDQRRHSDPTTESMERSMWGLQSEKEAHARTRTKLVDAYAERDALRAQVTALQQSNKANSEAAHQFREEREVVKADRNQLRDAIAQIALDLVVQPIDMAPKNVDAIRLKIAELKRSCESRALTIERVTAAHDEGVKAYRDAGGNTGHLPPTRTELVRWLLDTTRKLDAQLRDVCAERNKAIDDLNAALKAGETIQQQRDNTRAALDAATRESNALKAACTKHSTRVRDLEDQAARRDKLEHARQALHDELCDRIKTLADEKYGPFPAMSADDALTAIAKRIYLDSIREQAGVQLAEAIAGVGSAFVLYVSRDGVSRALQAYRDSERNYREQREAWEATFYRSIGATPEPDDCQAGTCDCPSSGYEIEHAKGCQLDALAEVVGVRRDPGSGAV